MSTLQERAQEILDQRAQEAASGEAASLAAEEDKRAGKELGREFVRFVKSHEIPSRPLCPGNKWGEPTSRRPLRKVWVVRSYQPGYEDSGTPGLAVASDGTVYKYTLFRKEYGDEPLLVLESEDWGGTHNHYYYDAAAADILAGHPPKP